MVKWLALFSTLDDSKYLQGVAQPGARLSRGRGVKGNWALEAEVENWEWDRIAEVV